MMWGLGVNHFDPFFLLTAVSLDCKIANTCGFISTNFSQL